VVEGPTHAVFSGAVGAGFGWTRQPGAARIVAPLLGCAGAIGQHVLWNGVASHAITDAVCGAPVTGGACALVPPAHGLFLTAPAITVAFLGPGGLALLAVVRAGGRRTRQPERLAGLP
jgi:hypothetical protein